MAEASPMSAPRFWGDEKYADATIIMGQKHWRVHQWVICPQSPYFEKALSGEFMEAQTKTINLTGSQFLKEQVDGLLRYLYFNELQPDQMKEPIPTFFVADYFQVASLRAKAAEHFGTKIRGHAQKRWFVHFKDCCHVVLGQHQDTELEKTVIKVIAGNINTVMHESGAWDELTDAYPSLAKKVLEVMHPKPTSIKRPTRIAFDDTLQPSRHVKTRGSYRPGSAYY